MNILFLSQENPYPPDGGHYIRTYNTLKILAEEHDIYFIAIANDDERTRNKRGLSRLCKTVDIFVLSQGNSKWKFLLLIISNLFSLLPFTAQKNYIRSVRIKIKKVISDLKIDLVHVDILPLAIYYKDFKNHPKVLVNHNVESLRLFRWMQIEKNIFIKLFLFYQYYKLSRFERRMCHKFDRCIVVSEPDRKILEAMCRVKNFETKLIIQL